MKKIIFLVILLFNINIFANEFFYEKEECDYKCPKCGAITCVRYTYGFTNNINMYFYKCTNLHTFILTSFDDIEKIGGKIIYAEYNPKFDRGSGLTNINIANINTNIFYN